MKQLLLLTCMTFGCALGALTSPFWGILLYYTFAVLRPQYLWKWALPVDVRWSLLAAGITLISVILHLPRLFSKGKINAIMGMMVVYGLLLLFSTITAFNPNIAQRWGEEYAKVLLIAVIASVVINQLWQFRMLSLMILGMLGYIAWEINSLYFLQGGRLDIYHYGYGGLDNNGAGLMLAMGLPFAYAFALGNRGEWAWLKMAGCVFLAGCIAHAVLMSYSRGAMLAGTVGLGWLLWHHRPRTQAVALAVVALIAISVMAGPEIRERFISITDYKEDASAQSRFDSWAAAWKITWENPVLGKGIRNSNYFSQNYGADMHGRTIHNQYLQMAADSGVLAALLYMVMLAMALWNFGSARRACLRAAEDYADDSDEHQELTRTSRICIAAQASLLTFAFGAFFLSLETFELPWMLIMLGGVAPIVVHQRIDELQTSDEQAGPAHTATPDLALTHGVSV